MFYSKKCWVLLGSANASLSLRYNPAYKSEGLLFLSTQNLAEKQQKNGPSWPLSLDFSRLPHYGVGAGRLVTPYNKIYEQCKRPTCVCPTYLWRSIARVRGNSLPRGEVCILWPKVIHLYSRRTGGKFWYFHDLLPLFG